MDYKKVIGGKFLNNLFVRPFFNRVSYKLFRMFAVPYMIQQEKEHEENLILQHIEDNSLYTPLKNNKKKEVIEKKSNEKK